MATAPVAHAAPTPIGSCTGALLLAKTTPVLGDQTQIGETVQGALAKDQTSKAAIAGNCGAAARPGDPNSGGSAGPFTPKAVAMKLVGNVGCAQGPTAVAVDATAAAAWPISGSLKYTMTQTYISPKGPKNYAIQAQVSSLGNPGPGPDTVDIGGIVLKGNAAGATVTGSIWQNPVAKTGGPSGYNTGYELDLSGALGCADGVPNNAALPQLLIGGGGATSTSLLGSSASGVAFTLGE